MDIIVELEDFFFELYEANKEFHPELIELEGAKKSFDDIQEVFNKILHPSVPLPEVF